MTDRSVRILTLVLASWMGVVVPTWAKAQSGSGSRLVRLEGTLYDSLSASPLAGARVSIVERSLQTFADNLGHFTFDSLGAGNLTIFVEHQRLESSGLPALSFQTIVADTNLSISLATPSLQTVWTLLCSDRPAFSANSGIIQGSVTLLSMDVPVREARVSAKWSDATGPQELNVISDSTGAFALCGIPRLPSVQLALDVEGNRTLPVSFSTATWPVLRRDLPVSFDSDLALLAGQKESDASLSTTTDSALVSGHVLGSGQKPIVGAAIRIRGTGLKTASSVSGGFAIRNVPLGTHLLEVTAIGFAPFYRIGRFSQGDTVKVEAQLQRVSTLASIEVRAAAESRLSALEQRRRSGQGYFFDTTALRAVSYTHQAVQVPGVRVDVRPGAEPSFWTSRPQIGKGPLARCVMQTIVNGGTAAGAIMGSLDSSKDDIAFIEVYPRSGSAPQQYMPLDVGTCGVVLVWTKTYLGLK